MSEDYITEEDHERLTALVDTIEESYTELENILRGSLRNALYDRAKAYPLAFIKQAIDDHPASLRVIIDEAEEYIGEDEDEEYIGEDEDEE